ncbi:MAG: lysophospholipid acyltransferase family protein [Pseudomonadota bacterium]
MRDNLAMLGAIRKHGSGCVAQRLLYRLIAILFLVFIFVTSLIFFVVALLVWAATAPFDPRRRILHLFTSFWASLYIWVFPPWSVHITGREKFDPTKTYIIVSNHQSMVDILAAFTLFRHFKWVSKAELFRIPLIGWNMSLNRYVKLQRGHKRSIREMYTACERHLAEGSSVFLFPEGTRSATGRMREFKEGAFVLAKRHQLPILPMVINGSKNALPKNSLNYHGRTRVELEVLDELAPEAFAHLTVTELTEMVREQIRCRVVEEQAAAD